MSESGSDLSGSNEIVDVISDEDFDDHEMDTLEIEDNSLLTFDQCKGCMDDSARIYCAQNRLYECQLSGFDDSVTCVKFNYSGMILAVGDMSGKVNIFCFKSNDWTKVYAINCNEDLVYMNWFEPTNNSTCKTQALTTLDESGSLNIWPIVYKSQTTEIIYPIPKFIAHSANVVSFSHVSINNTDHIALLSKNFCLKVFNMNSLESIKSFVTHSSIEKEEENGCSLMEISTDEQAIFAIGHFDGRIVIINVDNFLKTPDNNKVVNNLPCFSTSSCQIEALSFSKTHPFLAFGNNDGIIGLIDHSSNNLRCKWNANPEFQQSVGVTCIRWFETKSYFITASLDFSLKVWPGVFSSEPSCLLKLTGHIDTIMDILIINNDNNLVTASEDNTIKVYDLTSVK